MEKSEFLALFTEYAQKKYEPGIEDCEKNILEICEKQPELLIMPGYDKRYYGEAAELIVKLGYEKFKLHIEEVFVWLQDVNWPAADIIIEFLGTIPQNELIIHLKNILWIAYNENDDWWINGINYVIKKAKLSEYFFSDDEFRRILEFGYCSEEVDDFDSIFIVEDFESEFQANLKESNVTKFDLHFCSKEEIMNLVKNMALRNIAQTERDKQKYQKEINKIREGYKAKYKYF